MRYLVARLGRWLAPCLLPDVPGLVPVYRLPVLSLQRYLIVGPGRCPGLGLVLVVLFVDGSHFFVELVSLSLIVSPGYGVYRFGSVVVVLVVLPGVSYFYRGGVVVKQRLLFVV